MTMKSVESKMKLHLSNGRITNATVLDDGTCELTVALDNNVEVQNIDVHKGLKISKGDSFVLIEASKLSLKDELMQYMPIAGFQKKFKERLTEAIESGLSDFWASKLDPSFSEDGTGLVFKAGKMPAVGRTYNWWEEKAKQYLPERRSHLGTKNEYVAFLGVLIKNLVASGWSMSQAWYAVCDESQELGHYWNSENAKNDFETTGSREICGFCDLANTYKILAWDEEYLDPLGAWIAGGTYYDFAYDLPLAGLRHLGNQYYAGNVGTGWIVLSK